MVTDNIAYIRVSNFRDDYSTNTVSMDYILEIKLMEKKFRLQ